MALKDVIELTKRYAHNVEQTEQTYKQSSVDKVIRKSKLIRAVRGVTCLAGRYSLVVFFSDSNFWKSNLQGGMSLAFYKTAVH